MLTLSTKPCKEFCICTASYHLNDVQMVASRAEHSCSACMLWANSLDQNTYSYNLQFMTLARKKHW